MKHSQRTLIHIIHQYDGEDSMKNMLSRPWASHRDSYQRCLSHARSVGLEVVMVPEGSKLMLNLILTV